MVQGTAQPCQWSEYVTRQLYLGYTPMLGAQLPSIGFGGGAWRRKRERFVGWSETHRARNLQLVVNNARLSVLPWTQLKGLASKVLPRVVRQLPQDWLQRYGNSPMLLATFIESERHKGIWHKATKWINVGGTSGRGKKSLAARRLTPSRTSRPLRYARPALPSCLSGRDGLTGWLRAMFSAKDDIFDFKQHLSVKETELPSVGNLLAAKFRQKSQPNHHITVNLGPSQQA